ncbi:MAG: hypothetical protein EOO27_13985 [Comamonadaceae bacterium]|nr:MAG: hypothetical protein EOO27_13985 [Comamonadaceae bacterium]
MSGHLNFARHHAAHAATEPDPIVAAQHHNIALDALIEAVANLEDGEPWHPYLAYDDDSNRVQLIIPIPLFGHRLVIPTPLEAH